MATRQKTGRMTHMYKLDSKLYADSVKNAGEAAGRALRSYGEPTVSLSELRARVNSELGTLSLAELILKERAAGW